MHDSELPGDEPAKIKVTDRRLFDSAGNLRDGVDADEAPPESAPAPSDAAATEEPVPAAAPVEPPPVEPAAEANEAADSAAPPEQDIAAAPAPIAPLREEALMRFIEEQYIGGLLALGAMPEPQSGQMVEDLDLAQVRIEVLGMLREGAADSLSAEAQKGVDDVIYQLRMAYLQKSKVAKL
jgi:hypothetical protein